MALYRQVIRILIEHKGLSCTAVRWRRVKMSIPRGRPLPRSGDPTGFWVELQDANHRTLYWETMWRPFMQTIETSTGGRRGGQMQHHPVANPHGFFDVVVPDLPEGREVVLFSSPLDPGKEWEPAQEVFRTKINLP